MEIILYDPVSKKILSQSSNNRLNVVNPKLQSNLDYAIMRFEVDDHLVNKSLYILFHIQNATHEDDCLDVNL